MGRARFVEAVKRAVRHGWHIRYCNWRCCVLMHEAAGGGLFFIAIAHDGEVTC